MEQDTKDLKKTAKQSVQPRAKGEQSSGFLGFMNYLSSGSYRIAPWWSPQRDEDLSTFWRDSDHLSAAMSTLTAKVATVPVRVLPRNTAVKKHQRDAEDFTILINEEAEFGEGWTVCVSKWLEDWWASDNGAFLEIIGAGKKDGPIRGPAMGLAHLDSLRCTRTGNPQYPVLYRAPDGQISKLHRTRVMYSSDHPSAREEMHGVGFSAIGRCANVAQNLMDIATYKEEKLGSRPLRAILQARGISTTSVVDALKIAGEEMDSQSLRIFSKLAILGDIPSDAALELLDLVSLPDGFDEEMSTRLGMYVVAMAFNVPIRWLWPAATTGATKADAMYQHIAGMGGGIGLVLRTLTLGLGGDPRGSKHGIGKLLPPHLKLAFDFQDDEQDRNKAEIGEKRAASRNANLETGVIDVRTAREQALEAGDITQGQFESMELEEGRLPTGESVLSLFHSTKEPYFRWLDLGVANPLAVSANKPMDMLTEINIAAINVQDAIANTGNPNTRQYGKQALAALNQLKGMYAPLAQQQVQNEVFQRFGIQTSAAPAADTPTAAAPTTEEAPPTEAATKDFDYSVGSGEVIGGQLGRGARGQFINTADMLADIQASMLSRLGAGGENSADLLRQQNRIELAKKLGISVDDLNGLANMRTGDASPEVEAKLADMGLATRNADGSITMTKDARTLLSSANAGDVDKAQEALAESRAPKKGKAAKKPKKSAEQKRKEKEAEQERIRNENIDKVVDELDMPVADFQTLRNFYEKGTELTVGQSQSLARQGLVEIDKDGRSRLTREGRGLMRSAEMGDIRTAKDTLSLAAERVDDTLTKATSYRERANELEQTAQTRVTDAQERVVQIQRNIDEMQNTAATYEIEAMQYDTEADKLQSDIDGLDEMIANAKDAKTKARFQRERDTVEKQMQRALDSAERKRELLNTVYGRIQDANSNLATLANSITKTLEDLRKQAESYREQAQELEDSVGGAAGRKERKSLMRRLLDSVSRKSDKVEAKGEPNPFTAMDILVTEEDIADAIKQWSENEALPAAAYPLLLSSQATPEQIAEARIEEELI